MDKLKIVGLKVHEAEMLIANKVDELVDAVNRLEANSKTETVEPAEKSCENCGTTKFVGVSNDGLMSGVVGPCNLCNIKNNYWTPKSPPEWVEDANKHFEKLNTHNCDSSNQPDDKLEGILKTLEHTNKTADKIIDVLTKPQPLTYSEIESLAREYAEVTWTDLWHKGEVIQSYIAGHKACLERFNKKAQEDKQ